MAIICHSFVRLFTLALLTTVCGCLSARAQTAPEITVEGLLQQGWQMLGYAGGGDVRSAWILFQKPGQIHLVQCSTVYDFRSKRVTIKCDELH
jgi:hypothetical protein